MLYEHGIDGIDTYKLLIIATYLLSATFQDSSKQNYGFGFVRFPEIIQTGTYIDKSPMIKTFLEDNEKVVYITAPRNCGKTLNVQLLKHFLDIEVDENGKEITNKTQTKNYKLFSKLQILNHTLFEVAYISASTQ